MLNPAADRLIETIRGGVIGADIALEGPYGERRVTYADYTASGRSLRFIEEFVAKHVLTLYANTHTETSGTGLQTTKFREDARRIISDAVGATDEDVVIFCGSGATGAINKLVDVLNIRLPTDLDLRHELRAQIPLDERPVVFIGPYEHHSNELPWRESIGDVVTIEEDENGSIDLVHLEEELKRYESRKLKIGSFSAASNVTGIGSNTAETAILLHRYGALSFWDFAAAAPYVKMEMNMVGEGENAELAYKDAIFLSTHKFIGGPGTPGVLIAKRALFKNQVPASPGGGTVLYVNRTDHVYDGRPEVREEGGTPDIVGAIRAGLVFQLKESVGCDIIREREHDFIRRTVTRWSANGKINILGNHDAWRLSIVSFLIRHKDRYLHHNYAVALLNDLFGIQARGGCSCAGPYGHRLLGIDKELSLKFGAEIIRGCDGVKPGWVRVNFNYFISEVTFEFIQAAVEWVAEHGWKLLPHYKFSAESGVWYHRRGHPTPPMGLDDVSYRLGRMEFRSRLSTEPERTLSTYIEAADEVLAEAIAAYANEESVPEALPENFEELRWFPLPHEALAEIREL